MKKFNKISLSVILFLGITEQSRAEFPVFDPAVLTGIVQELMQEAKDQAVNVGNAIMGMMTTAESVGTQVDNQIALAVNSITRNDASRMKIANNQMKKEFQPMANSCDNLVVNTDLYSSVCASMNRRQLLSEQSSEEMIDNSKTSVVKTAEKTDDVLSRAKALAEKKGVKTDGKEIVLASIINPVILTGSDGDTFDDDKKESMALYTDLIVGTDLPEKPRNINSNPSAYMSYMQTLGLKQLVRTSMDSVTASYFSPDSENTPSEMQGLQDFVDIRFGSEAGAKWLTRISNNSDTEEAISESAVVRDIAVQMSFSNYLSVLSYRADLRRELLLAGILTKAIGDKK